MQRMLTLLLADNLVNSLGENTDASLRKISHYSDLRLDATKSLLQAQRTQRLHREEQVTCGCKPL